MRTLAAGASSRKQAWTTKLISISSSCLPAGGGHVSLQVLAGRLRTGDSHALRCRDTDQVEQVGHSLAGRLAEEQPGARELAVIDNHPQARILVAGVVETVDPLCQPLPVMGQVVRRQLPSGLLDDVG